MNISLMAPLDGPGSSAKGKRWGKSGRKRAGQKGYRELLVPERVDEFVDLFPPTCLCCGHPLPRVIDAVACCYQQFDLRDHRVHLTQWRRQEVMCDRREDRKRRQSAGDHNDGANDLST